MDKLFNIYSIDEISKQTHISPVVLEKLKNGNFSKLPKIKLIGFIKILEEEYPEYDFSKLKEDIKSHFDTSKEEIADIPIKTTSETSSNKLYFLVVLLLIAIGGLLYYMNNKTTTKSEQLSHYQTKKIEINKTILNVISTKDETNETNETNITEISQKIVPINKTNITEVENKTELQKKVKDLKLYIIPIKKVWFRVTYLDDLSSKEYLTTNKIELNGSRPIFLKFGHGYVELDYNHKILSPKTKSITRVIIEDGEMNITTKKVGDFK